MQSLIGGSVKLEIDRVERYPYSYTAQQSVRHTSIRVSFRGESLWRFFDPESNPGVTRVEKSQVWTPNQQAERRLRSNQIDHELSSKFCQMSPNPTYVLAVVEVFPAGAQDLRKTADKGLPTIRS